MYIQIKLYKKSKSLFGKGIRLKQNLQNYPYRFAQYSHVELVFSYDKEAMQIIEGIDNIELDNNLKGNIQDFKNYGLSFSSEEGKGVRFKYIDWKEYNWDEVDIEVSKKQYFKLLNFALHKNGNRYNKIGIILAQILNFKFKKADEYFCSEIVSKMLQLVHVSDELCLQDSMFINPAKIAQILDKKYLIK